MRRGQLREYFTGAATKRLSAVDADRFRSNQHEIGTTKNMRRQFLGEPVREKFETTYVWLDEGQEAFRAEGFATHYDVRAQKEDRSTDGLTDNQATLGWHPKPLYLVLLHVMLGPIVRPNMLKNVYLAIGEFSSLSVLRPVVDTSIVETSCKSLTAISQTRLLYNGCC